MQLSPPGSTTMHGAQESEPQGATATGFAGRQSYAHTSDTSQILPRSWGLAVRELLLAARPKFTGIYVGNGLRFAEIRLSWLKKHTHTHTPRTPMHDCYRPAKWSSMPHQNYTQATNQTNLWSDGAYRPVSSIVPSEPKAKTVC